MGTTLLCAASSEDGSVIAKELVPWIIGVLILAIVLLVVSVLIYANKKDLCKVTVYYGFKYKNKMVIRMLEGDNIYNEIKKIKFTFSVARDVNGECILEVKDAYIDEIYADKDQTWKVKPTATIKGDTELYCTVKEKE